MNTESNRETVETAFALGGFGASNFHGLGVLQAALDRNLVPDMISCTSGDAFAALNRKACRQLGWRRKMAIVFRRGEIGERAADAILVISEKDVL